MSTECQTLRHGKIPSTACSKGAWFSEGSPANVEHSPFPFPAKPIHSQALWIGEMKGAWRSWWTETLWGSTKRSTELFSWVWNNPMHWYQPSSWKPAAAENYMIWWTSEWVLDTGVISSQIKQVWLAVVRPHLSYCIKLWASQPEGLRRNNRGPSGVQKDGLGPTAAERAKLV